MENDYIVLDGGQHSALALSISDRTNSKGNITVKRFLDGEISVKIGESVRDKKVFLIAPTCPPVNDSLMGLMITLDALRRASATEVSVVMPYFGYARQDKKAHPREPITASMVAHMIQMYSNVSRVIALDLHAPQIQGFFDIPVDHLYGGPLIADHLYKREFHKRNIVIISPDVSSVGRAKNLADVLKCDIAIIAKRRPEAGRVEIMNVIGDVSDKTCIIIDDMIDSGNTIIKGSEALMHHGATDVYVTATHGLFSGDSRNKFMEAEHIKEVICLNSTPMTQEKVFDKLTVIDVAPMLSEAIDRIAKGKSVSEMFESK
jgi:ribose-phosphate pyrophosphokinase